MNTKSNVFIISGPSCSGKDTLYAEIKKLIPDIKQITSVTTREQRPNETEGVDYYYVSEEEFKDMIDKEVFVEYISYDNHLYGILKKELKAALESNGIYVLVIDVRGAIKIKELFPQVVTIFIMPPSLEELKCRLITRGVNTEEEITNRLCIADSEMKLQHKYDYRVVNDILENSVDEVKNIIIKHYTEGSEA